VPVLDNLEVTVAVRHEDFHDFGFSETVPKFSALFTPAEWLSLRGSWGKGFLAPTLAELTVLTVPSCAEQFGGADPIVGTLNSDGTWAGAPLAGAQSCTNGSDDLLPEKSKIYNFGFTIQPFDALELSLDYQEIKYTDQIRQLSLIDTVEQDYANFLSANGMSSDSYRSLPVDQRDALARAWAANPERVIRHPTTALIEAVNRSSVNIAEVDVGVLDFRADLGFAIGDYGFLNFNWATTHYTKYDYIDLTGEKTDALGNRNDDTDIVPPMPKFKHMARVAWTYNHHLVALVAKGYSSVNFDGTVGPSFGPGLGAEVPEKIDGQWVVNLRYGYTFENLFGGAGVLDVAVGANNLFNEKADPLPVQGGLESRLQDPFGRMLYLEATWSVE
jgi:iron complex outermembrane receptor protein